MFTALLVGCSQKSEPPQASPLETAKSESKPPTSTDLEEKLQTSPARRIKTPPRLDEPPKVADAKAREVKLKDDRKPVEIAFVLIPAGKFRRGSTPEQHQKLKALGSRQDPTLVVDELPAKMVTIAKPFEMAATEVTQAQYEAVMGNNPAKKKGPDLPVNNMPFKDAVEFCKRMTERTGRVHRLPTEAEWEYACRAGSDAIWCFGDDIEKLGDFAWFEDNSDGKVNPVGKKMPNAFGLYDMHGNVWEWCSDWYGGDYFATGPDVDPKGPPAGEGHVVRGGAAFDEAWLCRSAERDFGPPVPRVNLGFRVVRELP